MMSNPYEFTPDTTNIFDFFFFNIFRVNLFFSTRPPPPIPVVVPHRVNIVMKLPAID